MVWDTSTSDVEQYRKIWVVIVGCDSGMMDVEGMRVYTCTPPIGGQA